MRTLEDILKSRPPKVTFDPPADKPPDKTEGGSPPYPLPAELIREIAGKSEAEISTLMSKFRTGLSEHRTHASEHRTDLSEHRTDLSQYRSELSDLRTELSKHRTELSEHRTDLSEHRTRCRTRARCCERAHAPWLSAHRYFPDDVWRQPDVQLKDASPLAAPIV